LPRALLEALADSGVDRYFLLPPLLLPAAFLGLVRLGGTGPRAMLPLLGGLPGLLGVRRPRQRAHEARREGGAEQRAARPGRSHASGLQLEAASDLETSTLDGSSVL